MVPSLPSFVWLLPQKGEKLIQSESSREYSEAFHYYITFTYIRMYIVHCTLTSIWEKILTSISSLKGICIRNVSYELNFKIMPKCFLPSDIQIQMGFYKIFKRCFLPMSCLLLSWQSIQSFFASQVLRNYLLSKNISVNKSIIWLSHQVSDTFYHFIHTFSPLEARLSVFLSFYVTKFCFWNGELRGNTRSIM